ncbi:hypothetical protein RND81_10G112000 [Saponaria officinalis]|uniref:Uncharacterized protein n=1 Tax=Saponaria officinalis TaxID=3572 RepID=A0AAW1I331_SAPOF
MESETLENCQISAMPETSTSSSWPILRGCFDDVVTCESSISAVDDSCSDHTSPKSPLVLRRPSLDSGPCEITLLFTQQHEIKQVYIRSTAKVYEIYCATNEKSENEYLCTVRCGIVARDEELHQEADGLGCSTTSSRSIDEVHSRTDSGSSTDGDGWVDIKLNKSSRVDTGDTSLSKKEESCLVQIIQDRFEATAEISDGDPVISITLRLLSIQSGDYIYVDEVYVFADPVVSADNHCSVSSPEASSGGAMLSMFLPTLLQLSKSRMSKVQEHRGFDAGERSVNQDTAHVSTGTAVTSTNIVQTADLPNMASNGAFVHQPNHLLQLPNSDNRTHLTSRENDSACNKMEQTLQELVSRVTKIEELCLRFEKNMLKPIINMETRLERVEQHLESFIKNPQFPRTGCTIYSAPEFSCNESESDSICIGGNDSSVTLTSESSKKDDCCPSELCIPTLKSASTLESESISASQLLPGLIISAPEFSNTDEEEAIDSLEAIVGSPKVIKKPMSIDDALASALAGFVSSALTNPLERNVTVQEAEMVCGSERSGTTSPSTLSMALEKQLECTEMVEQENFSAIEGVGNTFASASVHSDEHQLSSVPIDGGNTSSKDVMVTEDPYLAVSGGEETTEAVDENYRVLYEGGSKTPHDSSAYSLGETEKKGSIAGIGCTESYHDASQTIVSDFCDSLSVIESAPSKNVDSFPDGNPNACPAVLQDIIQLPSPAIVDFSVPMLDVKFSSSESGRSSLESLLVDKPDIESDVPCLREDDTSSFNEHYDLVVVEDEQSVDPETDNSKLLYDDVFNSDYMASEIELQDSSYCSNQDMCSSLI